VGLRKKPSPTELPLGFTIDPEPIEETLTSWGGTPLLLQAFRSLGLPRSVGQHMHIKQRDRGFDEASMVESFVVLHALGGDCLDDFARLREETGLREMLGHELPSPEAARNFLYQFHDPKLIAEAQQELTAGQVAYIPEENAALQGLGRVNDDLLREMGRRDTLQKIATVDQDSTIIESHKKEALTTYEGSRGYQPMLAVWAETELVLADEFRDGNVPAMQSPLGVAKAAFQALPEGVEQYYYRGDPACHEHELIDWLRDEQREAGHERQIVLGIAQSQSEDCTDQEDLDSDAPTAPPSQRQRRRDAINEGRPQKLECVGRANQGEGADGCAPYAVRCKPCRESGVGKQERQATCKSECKHLQHARLSIACDCLAPVGPSVFLADLGPVLHFNSRAPCFSLLPCFSFLNEGSLEAILEWFGYSTDERVNISRMATLALSLSGCGGAGRYRAHHLRPEHLSGAARNSTRSRRARLQFPRRHAARAVRSADAAEARLVDMRCHPENMSRPERAKRVEGPAFRVLP